MIHKNKIIARIKGGLGNQLFCYAAARRLALVNNAELIIDDVTGFIRDHVYHRHYMLDWFNISARKATSAERMEPFERYRRGIMKWVSRKKPFMKRSYLEQEGCDFDERLLHFRVEDCLYLDGLWQSEGYFKDVETTIRADLRIIPPMDALNQSMQKNVCMNNSVALHVRWFDAPGMNPIHNVSNDYYKNAIALMESKSVKPHYFLFSDDPKAARDRLRLPSGRVTFVAHNKGDHHAYADLWLMSQCHHFIIANSTFSWWGAWMGERSDKIVIAPNLKIEGKMAWGFSGLIPTGWLKI